MHSVYMPCNYNYTNMRTQSCEDTIQWEVTYPNFSDSKPHNNDIHRYFAVHEMENTLICIQVYLSEHFGCTTTFWSELARISDFLFCS